MAAGPDDSTRFACDAMCGGLARWLRAFGYDATFSPAIDDGQLVDQARRENRVLVSSDGRLFERRALRSGEVRGLFLPPGLRLLAQVRFVVESLHLTIGEPRCMSCGGELMIVSADAVGDRVPARSLTWATRFFECSRCGRVLWNGTHWRRISAVRQAAEEWAARTPE
jgi:uncharacterized protein with PIN domain